MSAPFNVFRGKVAALAAAAILMFGGISRLHAQSADGNLVGAITDPTGAGIPGATVEITGIGTGVTLSTTTNASGQYRFNNLLAGAYNLKVTHPGFATATLNNVAVALTETATANLALKLREVSTSVEVLESSALIDTTTSQVGQSFKSREAIDTPAASLPLGVLNLSLLGAGVASSGGLGLGDGPAVGGQRPRNNNFSVEGVDNNRKDVTGHNVDIPNEAVAEFSMLENQYSAEYGNGTGGQFNTVLRGGTNEIHGAAYEYLNNRNFNALDQSFKRQGILTHPRYDQSTFGGSVGGPVIKNKLFYYGLVQYNPYGSEGTASSAIYAPTAAGYSTLAGLPGVSQTNLGVLKQYLPAAASSSTTTSVGGVDIPIGVVPITQPSYTNIRTWLASVDYNISEADRLRGRYVDVRTSGFSISTLPALPSFFLGRTTTQKLFALSEFHSFTPTLLNEFRFGYNRYNDDIPAGNFQFPGLDVFPNITIEQDLNLQLGPFDGAPQSGIINTYQLIDNLSWMKGRHSFKFGWEGRKYIAPQTFTQRVRGDYGYSNLEGYLLDLQPDVIAERNVGGAPYDGNQVNTSFFAMDGFRVRPNLTLNLGVRYEYKGIPKGDRLQALNAISSVPGLLEFRAPQAQKLNFVPRLGVAYSPGTSGRTSIRAGFGMAYDKYFDNLGLLSTPPQVASTVHLDPSANTPNFLKNGGILPSAAGVNCSTVQDCRDNTSAYNYDQKLPYSIQWNAGVEHVFHQDYTAEVRYLGTRGVHLFTQSIINSQSVVTPSRYLPTYMQNPGAAALSGLQYTLGDLFAVDPIAPAYQPYFDNSLIFAFPNRGNSSYNGLAMELTRRFTRGLLFNASYTWSHAIDDSTADLYSTLLSPRRPQDFQNMAPERSSSFIDRRQRFTYTWVYDLPWFTHSPSALMRNLAGGFTFSGTYTFETPQYATVQSGTDSNLNADSAGDRAIVNINGVSNTGSGVTAIDRTGSAVPYGDESTVAYVANNPNAQYIVAGYGALANSGRQTIATQHINNFDLQVKKQFSFTERYKLQLAVQMFNAFNHPQYVPGYLNNVQFHESRDTRNNLIPGNALFNRSDLVFDSHARELQLTARFQF